MIIDSPIISGSLILTGSAAFTGSLTLSGSMTTIGTITATTLVVQTITSSISSITGSTSFGSSSINNHNFTGSLIVSGAMFVSSSGRVGMGTTNPISGLHMNESSSIVTLSKTVSALSSSVGALEWRNNHASSGVVWAKIDAVTLGTSANPWDYSNITFSTWNGFNSLAEKMRITNAGNVGIGTVNPIATLNVSGSLKVSGPTKSGFAAGVATLGLFNSSSAVMFTNGDSDYGTMFGTLNTGVGWIQQQRSDGTATAYNLLLQPNGGIIGIGTTSPLSTSALDVSFGGVTLMLGADNNAYTRTNNTEKVTRIASANYVNANLPMTMMLADSYSSNHDLKIGGGTSALYAATTIYLLTAADTTTVSGTERMRITSTGAVCIGVNSISANGLSAGSLSGPYGTLGITSSNPNGVVWGPYSTSAGLPQFSGNWASGGTWGVGPDSGANDSVLRFGTVTSGAGGISWTGGYIKLYATSFTPSSDYRLKDNIEDLQSPSLDDIQKLRPVKYDMLQHIENGVREYFPEKHIGFIAHEIQEVFPDIVSGQKDEVHGDGSPKYQTVDYDKLTVFLVKAVQELNTKLDAANAEIALLKAK